MNESTPPQTEMVNLTIDGIAVQVPKGTTVYKAVTQLKIDLPIFCYQNRMPPFGACRVCLVEVEKSPKLQTSCTLEATEGMVVRTQSAIAKEGRKEILELLLINHPLDCPICDRGGECPLQDQAMQFGPGESEFYEDKRRFKKPIPLGPVLMLDRERCVVCARCTRFGDLVAGDHALEFIDRGYRTEVGTPDGGPADSKFIGNTISICPVGALTSQVYRFRARPWDNTHTPSTCTLCPVGCSQTLDARDGEIMRTRSCENRDINDIWMCDKGWFGYEFTSHEDRLQQPLIRRNNTLEPVSWDEALSFIAEKIQEFKPAGKLAAFGGNPLTIEENYLFQQLMRDGAGVNHIDHRIGTPIIDLDAEGLPPGMEISIGECEELSFVVLLGLDITEEFPVIWLRLKQAINRGATVLFLGHFAPEVSRHLSETILHPPGDELEILKQHLPQIEKLAKEGKKSAFLVGSQYLSTPDRREILGELLKVKQRAPNLSINVLEGRGNSMGARLTGMRPDLGPFGERLANPGLNAVQVLETASRSGWDFLYVVGANPATRFPSKLWKEARDKLKLLVVQDLFLTETAQQADVVLPTLSYVEKRGTFMNVAGRIQNLLPGKEVPDEIYSDYEIFTWLTQKLNMQVRNGPLKSQLQSKGRSSETSSHASVKSVSKQSDGLTATFAYALFDHGVRMRHNPHVVELVKEPRARIHPSEAQKRRIQDGDTVRITANGNQISAKIKLDPAVAKNTLVLPLGFPEVPVHNLGTHLLNGLPVQLEK